jgi:uncharacterized Zn finger protein
MSRYSSQWAPYVPVAERRRKAESEMAKLRKKGHAVAPVLITGRKIATTFWGKAWCDTLESYRDFENRLPRGRTYVRNGSVVDLQIAPLSVTALVSGSSIYRVSVSVAALPKAHWQSICRDCAGGIDSLVELLQGRFSTGVMERICGQTNGLLPRPAEIKYSCSCPDYATMCKHIAAVLYGVGARLDEKPELLFRLRAVDESDLLAHVDAGLPLSKTAPAQGKILQTDDISALFGLDMAGSDSAAEAPITPKKSVPGRAAPGKTAKGGSEKPAKTVQPDEMPAPPAKPPRRGSKRAAPAAAAPEPAFEVTDDGYVKWWK